MSFALLHQNKNKEADSKTSTSAKPSPNHHINNFAMDSHDSIIHLQRTIGNQAVQKLMHSDIRFDFAKIDIQPKLKVSQPGDVYEQEADRVAEQVMKKSTPSRPGMAGSTVEERIDRKCSACEMKKTDEEEKKLNISRNSSSPSSFDTSSDATNEINKVLSSSGSFLDDGTREFMESRFGFDFSNVKIHENKEAAYSAKIIGARAYTIGSNIAFAEGQYNPNTQVGQRLIAHELSHIKQQAAAGIMNNRIIMRQREREQLPTDDVLKADILKLSAKLVYLQKEEEAKGQSFPETLKVETELATKSSIVAEKDPTRKEILFQRARIRELREELRSTTPSPKREEIVTQIQEHQDSLADALETNLEQLGLQHEALVTKRDTLRASHLWLEGDVNATIEDLRLEREINAVNREIRDAKTELDILRRIAKSDIAVAFSRKYEKEIRPLPGGGCMTAVYGGLEVVYSPAASSAIKKEVTTDAARILRETSKDTNDVDRIMETLRAHGMTGNKITAGYNSRKGKWEPAVEKIVLGMVDKNYLGWYFFGLSVSAGWHSVILVVDNSDGETTKIYWMDQYSRGFTKNVTGRLDEELKNWVPSYGYERTTVWPMIPSAETVVRIPTPMSL